MKSQVVLSSKIRNIISDELSANPIYGTPEHLLSVYNKTTFDEGGADIGNIKVNVNKARLAYSGSILKPLELPIDAMLIASSAAANIKPTGLNLRERVELHRFVSWSKKISNIHA